MRTCIKRRQDRFSDRRVTQLTGWKEGRNGKTATPQESGCASAKETLDSPSMRISVESLSKRYGRVHALDDVNLTVESGQIVAVLGVNGAGKTTFLRCLCGIVAGTGQILYDGEQLTRGNMTVRRRIAFLPDFPIAFPHYTVMRHVGMVLRLYGVDDHVMESRILDLLRGFDILSLIDTPMSKLSRGQAYKAACPSILALDDIRRRLCS